MEQKHDVRATSPPRERVRELGYNPDHLTQQEQVELLTLDRRMSSGQGTERIERSIGSTFDPRG